MPFATICRASFTGSDVDAIARAWPAVSSPGKQHITDLFGQFEQSEAVCHVAAALADNISKIVLGVTVIGDELLVTKRLVQRIEIRPLHVFNNRDLERHPVVNVSDQHRDLDKACPLSGPPAPFPGNDLMAPLTDRPHHNRLDNAMLVDGPGKIFQIRFVEMSSRIVRIAADKLDGNELVGPFPPPAFPGLRKAWSISPISAASPRPNLFFELSSLISTPLSV